MDSLIANLDAALKTNYPEYHAALGPGSPDEDIDELERVFGLPLPLLYRDFLAWRGPSPEGAPHRASGLVHNNTVMAARTVTREITLMRRLRNADVSWVTSAWWGKHYLPVLEKGNGDFICVDVAGEALLKEARWDEDSRKWEHVQNRPNIPGQVIDFDHASEFRSIQAPCFASWIEAITAAFEGRAFQVSRQTYGSTTYTGFDYSVDAVREIDTFTSAFGARNPGYPRDLEQQFWTD